MPSPILIDTDTASDDAVALIMALRTPTLRSRRSPSWRATSPLPQGSRNARYTVELCGATVPVYEGAARPLLREPPHATFFHGQDGIGDQGYPPPQDAAGAPATPSTR